MRKTKYTVTMTGKYKKYLSAINKRRKNTQKLKDVIAKLAMGEELPINNKDHALKGDWIGYRECHIEPDWLLIYRIDNGNLILSLMRTGTHSDLF